MGACPTTTEAMRKMGCKTSGGCLLCADRSGAETLDPWCLLYHDRSLAEDGASEVRGTSCHEPTEPEARP